MCCLAEVCAVYTETELETNASWSVLAGSWDAPTGVLSGASAVAVTVATASNPQHARAIVTANKPNQVLDIMLGCDGAGAPDMFARLTFGDSGVSDDCGSIQLFDETGTAYESAQPVYGMVDGVATRVTICVDAVFGRMFIEVRTAAPFVSVYPVGTATAQVTSDPSGRLGLRLYDHQSGTMTIDWAFFDRVWISPEACRVCEICGTSIEGTTPAWTTGSHCVWTVGSLFYHGINPIGVVSLDSQTIVSDLDRFQGYGVTAHGAALLSNTDSTSLEVYADNNHHTALLTLSERKSGSCPGIVSSPYHMDIELKVYKDAVLIGSDSVCMRVYYTGPELFEFFVSIAFCDGDIIVNAGASNGTPGGLETLFTIRTASAQVGDGSAHGALIGSGTGYDNDGGITSFVAQRCMNCPQCEDCEDPHDDDRSWQIEVAGTPSTYDGTYVVTGAASACGGTGTSGGVTWELSVRRNNLHVGIPKPSTNEFWVEGTSSAPLTDCDNLVDQVITLSGLITGTATINSL